jgi:shikimate kinase
MTRGIILIGFMGAGKSSVGRSLAERLGWAFEDLDERIETRERRKVHEIFRESGESAFRVAENKALRELLSEVQAGSRKVLALGGGAIIQEENARLIEAAGFPTVFLDADVKELWRRCREQADRESVERPLLSSLSNFRELHKKRRPHYERAMFHQATDGKAVDEIVVELAERLALPVYDEGVRGASRQTPKKQVLKRRKRGEKN